MEISSPHLSFFLCFLFSVHISLFPSCSLHMHFSLPLTRVEHLLYVCISCSRSLGALGPAHRERGGTPSPEDWPWGWNRWFKWGKRAGCCVRGPLIRLLPLNCKPQSEGAWTGLGFVGSGGSQPQTLGRCRDFPLGTEELWASGEKTAMLIPGGESVPGGRKSLCKGPEARGGQ